MDPSFDFYSLGIISLGLAVGAFIKGLTGMGLTLVAVPFMVSFVGAEHAIVVMQIPALVANLLLIRRHGNQIANLNLHLDLIVPAALMTVIGVWFLDTAHEYIIVLLLAGVIGIFLILNFINPSLRLEGRARQITVPLASLVGGFVQGATGVSGPLFSTLIFWFRLDKRDYVFHNGLIFALFNVIQIVAMFVLDMWTMQRFIEGCLALIPLFAFQHIGMWTMGHVDRTMFNRAILIVIVIMEMKLIWQGIGKATLIS